MSECQRRITQANDTGAYDVYHKQWDSIPEDVRHKILKIHLARVQKMSGLYVPEESSTVTWDPQTTIDSDDE